MTATLAQVGSAVKDVARLCAAVLASLILGAAVILSVPVILLGILGVALLEAATS